MNAEINAATRKWQRGEKVVIGRTNIINDRWTEGLTGTVDFEYDTLVYVLVRAKGMRKDRSICLHRDSLTAA
ncbi:hypothetical protein WT15_27325 [Burkholderia stagnalis]|uniref:hypothetical protein n=1 Tax=Burkholderia stagnalis TaxID=1503054 RepID=UPI0007554397|nr:hypothetical protein [Burkholderia stagnalis]KVN72791.1 hypothetical protein WT15_27325 [Burkholderia stagnalis]KWO38171.1 hypothetical protein WT96_12690 [Burkholderia stagnalis]KWO41107.1 hypothetical protein WT95_03155 [Burkholderia stagnalis]